MPLKLKAAGTVFADGHHNAFTAACRFKDRIYLAFRNSEGHQIPNGKIVLVSADEQELRWSDPITFSQDGDCRDPKLCIIRDRIHLMSCVISQAQEEKPSTEQHRTLHLTSADGRHFDSMPLQGLQPHSFFWGTVPTPHGYVGTAYRSTGQDSSYESCLYTTEDGQIWQAMKTIPIHFGNETSLAVNSQGNLCGIIRCEKEPFHPFAFRMNQDNTLSMRELPLAMQGILLHPLPDGDMLLAARRWDTPDRQNLRCDVFILTAAGKLDYQFTLPSAGDCSYPSAVDRQDGSILLFYYSSHAYWKDAGNFQDPEHSLPADICYAVISRQPLGKA